METKRVKKFVGGQAVIEGVMMRGPKYTATAVREPGGQIVVDTKPTSSISDKYPILKKPLLRGCVALYFQIRCLILYRFQNLQLPCLTSLSNSILYPT